jgi:hypothetical protein
MYQTKEEIVSVKTRRADRNKCRAEGRIYGGTTRAIAPGTAESRNRINRFHSDICFSKTTKRLSVYLVIIRNKNKARTAIT